MNQEYWESLKSYINQHMSATKEGAKVCDIVGIKNQMLTRADTFQEVLNIMKTYEEYKECDDNELE